MTFKNVANIGSVVTDKTIDSQYLLEMVNHARRQCGEKEVRNNDFIARIKDELEGEHYEIFVVQNQTRQLLKKLLCQLSKPFEWLLVNLKLFAAHL